MGEIYWDTFNQLQHHPAISTWEDVESFIRVLSHCVEEEHADVVDHLSCGVREVKHLPQSLALNHDDLDKFLDHFLQCRVSNRILREQLAWLSETCVTRRCHPGDLGVISPDCHIAELLRSATARAQRICESHYGVSPHVEFLGDLQSRIAYVPGHLEYCCFEIVKNALRATVEHSRALPVMPPVTVRLCHGDSLSIIISDQGGGIPPDLLSKIWSYGFTTTTSMEASWSPYPSHSKTLAGHGFGLKMSRLYLRYLKGGLILHSMYGYGTDAVMKLNPVDCTEDPIIL
eukprot:NODE_944_length_1076_cov_80.413827_g776_i0.p1 GENE.NODE_944_length_1076_cov_80.413827_g776_i0~~NODE_944_length_1076_cov_80.413827_g776_i0.p1  ORF type:complete len:288 (+),score=16.37 NODE_944_length_1076_cov_80.413827_g776_i0:32-895(+)